MAQTTVTVVWDLFMRVVTRLWFADFENILPMALVGCISGCGCGRGW